MEEWIIIEGSTEYGPCVSKFTGTKDEVKRLLMAMVDDDRNDEDGDIKRKMEEKMNESDKV